MKITVVYASEPLDVREWRTQLPEGSNVRQALAHCGALQALPELIEMLATGALTVGIWGRAVRADQLLLEDDRVEIYRPLRVDPKVARRERFKGQGSRGAGLFAHKRAGGKAGY
jgi:putative ubiquitin-RnfH superfamily antitoxin RatB of RatAB toxin-antitoxin module